MAKWPTTLLAIGIAVTLAACDQKQADADETAKKETTKDLVTSWGKRPKPKERAEQSDIEAAILVEAPETGVDLGWGWNTFQAEPIPTVCIEFARDEFEAQTTTLQFKEINDSFELMKTMDISAEVSVKTIGYSAKGKAKFAKEVNVSGFSSTFVIEAEVENGASYAAPTPPRPRRGASAASAAVEGEGAVRLTPEAAKLARDDVEMFKDVCGNGYVSATMGGAKLVAVVNIETSSQKEKEKIKTAVSGNGWGVKVSAAMEGSTESGTNKFKREISFYQTGGKNQSLPVATPATDSAPAKTATQAILERVEKLAEEASKAEKLFQIAVTPYEVLENWPRGTELTGEEAEFDELAALWGAYNTLYDEIQEAMDDPKGFVVPVAACTAAGDGGEQPRAVLAKSQCAVTFKKLADDSRAITALEDLQDEVLAALDRLELQAEACVASEEDCEFAGERYRSPYSIRNRLPIPACFLVEADATCNADVAPSGASSVKLYADTQLREMAKSRCRFGSLTPGCLSNAEIRQWAARIGMRSAVMEDESSLAEAIQCLSSGGVTALSGDPGTEAGTVIWFASDQPLEATLETAKKAGCKVAQGVRESTGAASAAQ